MSGFIKSIYALVIALLVITIVPLTGCDTTKKVNAKYEKAIVTARSEVWQDINSGKACSATIAIMDNGKVVYAEGFGMADREHSIPVDTDTIFNIGSISKIYCSTAIMLLVDDGKVNLDDYVTDYLPEFEMADPRYRDITVRMLLNHTSGLPGTTSANNFGFEFNPDVYSDTLENLSHSHLKYQPGEMAIYCNDGFTLAEIIVNRISGKKYIDFLAERIFQPLLLKNTGVSVGMVKGKPVAAYYQPGTGKKEPLQAVSILAAGGLGSTAEDLCRFVDSFSGSGEQILSAKLLEEMKKAQPSPFDNKLRNSAVSFGLGWDVTDLPEYQAQGIKIIGKSGGTPNYTSMVFSAPDHSVTVAVIEAGVHSSAAKIALNMLHNVLLQKGLIQDSENNIPIPLKSQNIPAEYADYYGYYIGNGGDLFKLDFNSQNNTIDLLAVHENTEQHVSSFFYNNSYLYTASGQRYYLTDVDGMKFLISPLLGMDNIGYQKLEMVSEQKYLDIDIDGRKWLRRNSKPYECILLSTTHLLTSNNVETLPGYVDLLGVKQVKSYDFAGMPGVVRDQSELTLIEKYRGQTWAMVSDMLYSPDITAIPLRKGENKVVITENSYSEWLNVDDNLVVTFQKPETGRIIIFTGNGESIYDTAVDTGGIYIERGSFIELMGQPEDVFKINTSMPD
jgi:CubicO group peptidase (beta-lactamase class C family)